MFVARVCVGNRLGGSRIAFVLVLFCIRALAADTPVGRTVRFREPQPSEYTLIAPSSASTGPQLSAKQATQWVQARIGSSTNRVEMSDRVALRLAPGKAVEPTIDGTGLTVARRVSPRLFILQAVSAEAAIDAAEALALQDGVEACYPVMRRPLKRFNVFAQEPNDPLFARQWHLDDRGLDLNLAGPDLNVRGAWPYTRGENVLVAIADDGFQLDHPDLKDNAEGNPHYDFFQDAPGGDPTAADSNHATAVAGLVAARDGNEVGVSGVAPQAHIASWVIFGTSPFGTDATATDEQLMNMFQYASNVVSVQNHSWGSATIVQSPIDSLSDEGIQNAVTLGRGGKGEVIVRAAGNGNDVSMNANDDGFSNDPRVIAVGAVRKDGLPCSYTSRGACVLVAAPSGDLDDSPDALDVFTTDRTGADGYNLNEDLTGSYTEFNGTSASSPQVAGIAALILSANPNLTYRDVQQVLINSSYHPNLNDPDARLNGAGYRVSHALGFGVPDAGAAVALAKIWSNRPPVTTVTVTNTTRQNIPDDALRVVCTGAAVPATLASIHCLPSQGPHPDSPTAALPLAYVGEANDEISDDLHGKGALIQRGTSFFVDKINHAAAAGAEFVIVFNNTGGTELIAMAGTAYTPIPAVFIDQNDGEALRDLIQANPETTAALKLSSAAYNFTVSDTLSCEHVAVRLKTTHTARADVRVTLVSPMGTRSILEEANQDTSAGPADWTYWTVHHFYEPSSGPWRLEVSDEGATRVRRFPSGTASATGAVTYAELIVQGVRIKDSDHDGLDDEWEMQHFRNLTSSQTSDPDNDGWSNVREELMGTDPLVANTELKLDFAELQPGYWRISWPARPGGRYTVFSREGLAGSWARLAQVVARTPVAEWVVKPEGSNRWYRITYDP